MAQGKKDRRKLQHIHSSIADRQPTPETLEVGEIAVNNAAGKEFLSIKSTDNKVRRFSSDEQMITWMEKKEVIPYKGYVKGRTANSTYGENPGAGDAYNSYGITNDDLLENKSQIIIKLNQVAAKNTGKYNKVNAATDKYGNTINPWSGETIGDGAGFYIDMSRYAMNGANPSFSSLTVTDKTDLSGNTTIANGDGTGTRNGHTLTIKTTDVISTNTNWTETITNHTSKVTTEKESATTRTTVVGTENLTVSGTTTEQHTGNVTITNKASVIEKTSGTTTIDRQGAVTVNSQSNVTEITSGNTLINHKGTTNYNYTGGTTLSGSTLASITTGNTSIHADGAIGITAVGDINAVSSESDIYITANDDLSTTAGDIAAFKGVNKTNIGIDTEGDEDSVVTNIYGETINTRAKTADTRVTSAYTNVTSATTTIGTANTQVSSAKTVISTANTNVATATLSGNTLDIKEATSITYSGGTFTSTSTGNTTLNASGNTTINTSGNTRIKSTGTTVIDSLDGVDIYGSTAVVSAGTVAVGGDDTLLEKAPAVEVSGTTTDIYGATTLTMTGTTVNTTGTTLNTTGGTVNISGGTGGVNITGATKLNGNTSITGTITTSSNANVGGNLKVTGTTDITGTTTIGGVTTINNNLNVTGNTKITGTTDISGKTTIDDDLDVTGKLKVTGTTNISGETTIDDNLKVTGTLNVTGNTTLAATTATTISASTSVKTPLVSATTISADTLYTKNGLEKSLSWEYGSVSAKTGSSYNGKESKTITVPKTISDVASGKVSSDASGNLSVSGTITATGAIYSSDINLKENVNDVEFTKLFDANGVQIRSFNFKNDDTKRKMYGVIAQEVEASGLEDIVVTKEDGFKGVDYTALSLLKIAYLENKVKQLEIMINKLIQNK